MSRAIGRVFAKLGEKKNRQKARLKFVVQKLGIEKFKEVVIEEWKTMPEDPVVAEVLRRNPPLRRKRRRSDPVPLTINGKKPEGIDRWAETNVYRQRQAGYATVTVTLPLGDLTSDQMRKLADLAHTYASDHARTTVDQNIVLRWVKEERSPGTCIRDLKAIGLAEAGCRHHRRCHQLPGHRYLQARHRQFARPGRRTSHATGCKERIALTRPSAICTLKSAAASIPAASITWRTWASTATAETSADTPSRISK